MRAKGFDTAPLYEAVRCGRRPCSKCSQHNAGFLYRGRFKYDCQHDLCMRCYRSAMSMRSAMILAFVM
jgi:hypothetical protein